MISSIHKALPVFLVLVLASSTVLLYQQLHGPGSLPQLGEDTVRELARLEAVLAESSALASHGDFLWTANDSGSGPVLHKLDRNGRLQESIEIPGADNIDWESMAQDETHLFVADTGNNRNSRDRFTIYRFAWANLVSGQTSYDTIRLRYGDYEQGNILSHNFDAEALTVKDDELWLFSKNRGDRRTKLYRFPKTPGEYAPMPSQQLEVDALITAADIHPVSGMLTLIGYRAAGLSILWKIPTDNGGVDWAQREERIIAPADQWEAVLWDTSDERVLLSHERSRRSYAGLAELIRW
jgi:hypothetical protein